MKAPKTILFSSRNVIHHPIFYICICTCTHADFSEPRDGAEAAISEASLRHICAPNHAPNIHIFQNQEMEQDRQELKQRYDAWLLEREEEKVENMTLKRQLVELQLAYEQQKQRTLVLEEQCASTKQRCDRNQAKVADVAVTEHMRAQKMQGSGASQLLASMIHVFFGACSNQVLCMYACMHMCVYAYTYAYIHTLTYSHVVQSQVQQKVLCKKKRN
jgi:hypothetical protein